MKLFDNLLNLGKKEKQVSPLNNLNNVIAPETLERIKQDIRRFRYAVMLAEDKNYLYRTELIRVYNELIDDDQFIAASESKKDRLTSMSFNLFNENGTVNDTATEFFNLEWFDKLFNLYIEAMFFGYSLVQINSISWQNVDISLIPRQNIIPTTKEYIKNISTNEKYSYDKPEMLKWLIEIGEAENLGILKRIGYYIILKRNSINFWAKFQEVFGMPFRIGKTNNTNPTARIALKEMLQNMGAAAWGIIGKDDEIILESNKNSDAFNVYFQFIQHIDKAINKIVLGATELTDGGANGSNARAEVHETQANIKTKRELKNFTYFVNNNLIPKLQNIMPDFPNVYFQFEDAENLTLLEKAELDTKVAGLIGTGLFDTDYIVERYNVTLKNDK